MARRGDDAIVGATRPDQTNGRPLMCIGGTPDRSEVESLQVEDEPDLRDLAFLEARLYDYNVSRTGVDGARWLTILRRDDRASDRGRAPRLDVGRLLLRPEPLGPRGSPPPGLGNPPPARGRGGGDGPRLPAGTPLDAGLPGPELLPEAGLPGDRPRRGLPGGSHHHPPATRSRFGSSRSRGLGRPSCERGALGGVLRRPLRPHLRASPAGRPLPRRGAGRGDD